MLKQAILRQYKTKVEKNDNLYEEKSDESKENKEMSIFQIERKLVDAKLAYFRLKVL